MTAISSTHVIHAEVIQPKAYDQMSVRDGSKWKGFKFER